MNIKKLAYSFLASGVIGICAGPAQATLILTLDAGGGNSITVTDGGAGDLDSRAGFIQFNQSLGTWITNLTFGVSNSPGTNDFANMFMGSTNISGNQLTSRGAGTLTITLTDSGFTSPSGLGFATTSVGGFTNGNVSFTSLLNGVSVGSFGSNSGAFSGTTTSGVDATGGFTLTQIAVITQLGAGATGFTINTTVPEPATLGLLGLGLIGLGFVSRRRKNPISSR